MMEASNSFLKLVVGALFCFILFFHVDAYYTDRYDSYDHGYSNHHEVRWNPNHAPAHPSTIDHAVRSLHPDELQRVTDFRLSPVSILLCKQWATEQYILQQKKGSPSRRSTQESVAVRIRNHIGVDFDEDTSGADLLARHICKPLLSKQKTAGESYGRQHEDSMNSNHQPRSQHLNRLGAGRKEEYSERGYRRSNDASLSSDSYGNQFKPYGSRYDSSYHLVYEPISDDPDKLLDKWLHDSGLSGMPLQGLAVHLTPDTEFGYGYEAARVAGTAVHQDMLRYCATQVTSPGGVVAVAPLFAQWRNRNAAIPGGPGRPAALAANQVTAADVAAYFAAPAAPIPFTTGPNVALGTFTLSLDNVSRVRFAGGWVQNVGVGTAAGNAPRRFTAMTYAAALGVPMPVGTGPLGVQVYNDFDVGHIVASSLCGNICNDSPLNFFPQRRDSNSASNWYWAELFAQNLRDRLLGGMTADTTIRIEITLEYATARWLIPDSGEYRIIWRPDRVELPATLVGGQPAIQNDLVNTPLSIRNLINGAAQEAGNPQFWRVVFPWTNPVRGAAQIVVP